MALLKGSGNNRLVSKLERSYAADNSTSNENDISIDIGPRNVVISASKPFSRMNREGRCSAHRGKW